MDDGEQFWQDLRYTFRTLAGNRLFTALAVLSLASANMAIYSFLDSILLRSLPVADSEPLVVLNWHAKQAKWGSFVMHSIDGTFDEDDGSTRQPSQTAAFYDELQKQFARRASRIDPMVALRHD